MRQVRLSRDTRAAATELGYVFTFLLGVLLMTMFSVWAWDIETNTRLRWNEEAVEANGSRMEQVRLWVWWQNEQSC